MIDELLPAEHLAGRAHQVLKQAVLGQGEGDGLPVSRNILRQRVERDPASAKDRPDVARRPSEKGADTGFQFSECEGLDEVVVRADIQTLDAVLNAVTSGGHEN